MTIKASVLLIGAGGVGTIAALNLTLGGQATVTAVLRSNYSKVATDGFHIKSVDHGEIKGWRPHEVVNKIPSHTEQQFDYIVVATKSIADHSPTTAELISPAVSPGKTIIVLIQNGLNIEKPFFERYPHNICLSGVSRIDSHEISPGFIEQVDRDRLIIGAFTNPNLEIAEQEAAAQAFVDIYSGGRKTFCEFTDNVPLHRWQKLVYNACMNTVCAVTGLDTGRIRLAGDTVETLLRPAMEEIVAAAKAAGIKLPQEIVDKTIDTDPLTLYMRPSMLEDVQRGNMTEFENLLGEPLREGTARGVPMPAATFLYHTLKAMQWRVKEQKGLISVPSKTV
ncbi:ketopantoate reductase PanE/ApbA C terminal-domain-containing protein [Aspergillus pseudoustus]|uniref:2-dehydropantoate 2-reductase n=1 Tax=Aspergillus pseudoustus TaxID=1810923 RepID=A0ABR4KAZ5_9EURO